MSRHLRSVTAADYLLASLKDACPECLMAVVPPVSLEAGAAEYVGSYRCPKCDREWTCSWNREWVDGWGGAA